MKTAARLPCLKAAAFALAAGWLPLAAPGLQAAPLAMAEVAGPGAESLARAELDFVKMAAEQGMGKAFDAYLADGAVSPPSTKGATLNKEAVVARMKKLDDGGMVLSWSPLKAETASSGDFGYTFGPWELHKKGDAKIVAHGYYSTVWKKDAAGAWKAIFDMGNETPPDDADAKQAP